MEEIAVRISDSPDARQAYESPTLTDLGGVEDFTNSVSVDFN